MKITGIVLAMVLISSILCVVPISAENEGIPVYVVEEGGKNLPPIQKFFSFLYIYGQSNIQLGKGTARTGDPPILTNPATSFKVGDNVGMILTVRDVRDGGKISLEFCKQGGSCSPAKIFYFGGGTYTEEYTIQGTWDVWWIVTSFSAAEGTWTLNTYTWDDKSNKVKIATQTFTVSGMQCQPNTKVCDGDMVKICKSDGSGYEYEYCWYGCLNGACKSAPTPTPTPQICTPYTKRCSGNNLQQCSYTGYEWTNIEYCTYGCNNNMCITPTPTPYYPTPTPTYPSPTPTPTVPPPPIPGFEAVFAIAGLLTCACLLLRRK